MTDYRDPNRRIDPDRPTYSDTTRTTYSDRTTASSGAPWGWILGAVALLLLLAALFGWGWDGMRTAETPTASPPATTGQGTTGTAPRTNTPSGSGTATSPSATPPAGSTK